MKRLFSVVMTFIILLSLAACGDDMPASTVHSPGDVSGKTVGVLEGSASASIAQEYGQTRVYSGAETLLAGVRAGEVDCAVADASCGSELSGSIKKITILEEPLAVRDFAFVAAKENPELIKLVNSALAGLAEDGTLAALVNWYIDGTGDMPPIPEPQESDTVIRLALSDEFPPYVYRKTTGELAGLDIHLAAIICDKLGAQLELVEVTEDKVLQTVQFGKAELGVGGLYETEEGAELVAYSSSYITCELKILVRK